ncbi:MAG: extracellular solute-binding protein family 5 [Bacteroidota bacterium]|jgi:peptide/nickel transport system substrate-binding protein|nr:extracellular solute-binding protein family 5 [Bacteroidota bacterium]
MKFNISIIAFAFSFLIFGCKNEGSKSKQSDKNGGTFVMAEDNHIATLYPLSITSQVEGLVASQIFECLVRLDAKTLEVIPGLAEKWEISSNGKLITFHLVKGAHFQNDPCYPDGKGPEITTRDVKFTLENMATKTENNYQFNTILKDRLVGVNDFFDKKASFISGLKIIDDYTFSLELENPSLSFTKLLANPAVALINEIAYKAYGQNLKTGAGPFIYDASSTKEKIILVKNPDYFLKDSAGNALPYLDTLIVLITPSIEDGLSLFENEKIDLINTLPSLRVKDVVEKNIKEFVSHPPKSLLQREPEMFTQFYVFNTKQKPFDNPQVRQAINYAIDREKLVDNVLQGQAIGAAVHGITPNTFSGYDIKKIKGYDLDVEKAKKLLAEAGYPNGKGFPEVRILVNSGNSRNSTVAVELQKQLKENLNINVNFESLPNVQKYELQMHGKSDLYRDAWVADFSSPESFLSLFSGDGVPVDFETASFPNTSRYQNATYDINFKKGRDANNKDTSYAYFMKAEQVLMDDAVIIPLWYEGSYRLLTNNVKGLYLNAMRYYDFTKAYKVK